MAESFSRPPVCIINIDQGENREASKLDLRNGELYF